MTYYRYLTANEIVLAGDERHGLDGLFQFDTRSPGWHAASSTQVGFPAGEFRYAIFRRKVELVQYDPALVYIGSGEYTTAMDSDPFGDWLELDAVVKALNLMKE